MYCDQEMTRNHHLLSWILFLIAAAIPGLHAQTEQSSTPKVRVPNGYVAFREDKSKLSATIGSTFTIKLKALDMLSGAEKKLATAIQWEVLTPDLIEMVDGNLGLFRAKKVGNGVVRALIYAGQIPETDTHEPQPMFRSTTILVTVDKLSRVVERRRPLFLPVKQKHTVRYFAFRQSKDEKDKERTEKNELLKELDRSLVQESLRPAGDNEDDQLLALVPDLPMSVESLSPEILQVSIPGRQPTAELQTSNSLPVELTGIASGKARIRVICGGLDEEFEYTVADPVLTVAAKTGTLRINDQRAYSITLLDRATNKPIKIDSPEAQQHAVIVFTTKSPGGVTSTTKIFSLDKVEKTVTFSESGVYNIAADFQWNSAVLAESKLTASVRSTVNSANLSDKFVRVVEGDVVKIPIFLKDSAGKDVPLVEAKDFTIQHDPQLGSAKVEKVQDQFHLVLSPRTLQDMSVTINVDDGSDEIMVRSLAHLEITPTVVSVRSARDLFGDQIAKEFIVRKLTFKNRLNQVIGVDSLKNKEILVYGNSMLTNVIVQRGKLSSTMLECKLKEAIEKASFMWGNNRATPEEYKRHIREVFSSNESNVAVMPYNPVLFAELSLVGGAVRSRRSIDVVQRLFEVIDLTTTFLSGLPTTNGDNSLFTIFGRTFRGTRNPFLGATAAKNKSLINTLFTGLMSVESNRLAQSGKALSSDYILDGTLSVPAGTSLQRYLLIPRDSLQKINRAKIIDIVDEGILVDYTIVTTARNSATSVGTPKS
jgi:hypothetical protein